MLQNWFSFISNRKKFKTLINMSLNMIEIKIMSYGRVKISLHINMQNWKFQQKLLVLQFWLASHWYVGILRQIRESFKILNFHYYFMWNSDSDSDFHEILMLSVNVVTFFVQFVRFLKFSGCQKKVVEEFMKICQGSCKILMGVSEICEFLMVSLNFVEF